MTDHHHVFADLGRRMFGGVGWQGRVAQSLAVTPSTVSTWATGKIDPPRSVILWLREMELRRTLQAGLTGINPDIHGDSYRTSE